jgi:hypothetical protein
MPGGGFCDSLLITSKIQNVKTKKNSSFIPARHIAADRYAQGGEGNPFFKIMVIK